MGIKYLQIIYNSLYSAYIKNSCNSIIRQTTNLKMGKARTSLVL